MKARGAFHKDGSDLTRVFLALQAKGCKIFKFNFDARSNVGLACPGVGRDAAPFSGIAHARWAYGNARSNVGLACPGISRDAAPSSGIAHARWAYGNAQSDVGLACPGVSRDVAQFSGIAQVMHIEDQA